MFKIKMKLYAGFLGFIFLFSINPLFAQKLYKNAADSKITANGTSTLHDWSMESQTFDCTVSLSEMIDGRAIVDQILFFMKVETLKSDKSGLDKNAYKTLKTKDIQFNSTSVDTIQILSDQFNGTLTGDLTIAGTTKPVSIPFKSKILNENEIETDLIYKINMKDFGMNPPTFMLGALKTGSEVEVIIHLKLHTINL